MMAKQTIKDTITWEPVKVKLGDLKPWGHNPRQSTKAQAARILQSFSEFGQVQAVAVGPELDVYDGHQRLSALLTLHGNGYEIDARQSSVALDEAQRQRLVLMLHAGATGEWNWDLLSSWDSALLQSSGIDAELLSQMNRDAAAIALMLGAADVDALWQGMPEFEQEDEMGFHQVIIHFESEEDMQEFSKLIDQPISRKVKTTWHPFKPRLNLKQFTVKDEP